jgi:hypothetical protein
MYRAVPVKCLGESYFWFMLFEIMNYLCDCVEEICSIYVSKGIESSWISRECAEVLYRNGHQRNGAYDSALWK